MQLAICWKLRASGGTRPRFCHTPVRRCTTHRRTAEAEAMGSDNPSGADNQQERPGFEEWVVGFVDGEGCFSISVVRN